MVYTEPGRNLVIGKAALLLGLALGLGTPPTAARADEDQAWQTLVDTYAGTYPAVITNREITMEVLFDTHYKASARMKFRTDLAVFDVKQAQEYLNQVFPLPYGYKVKHKRAWSMEHGAVLSGASAQDSDFHERTLFGKQKEVRVSIPGLREKGYAAVELEIQGEGLPALSLEFAQDLPVKKAAFTLKVPGTAGEGASGIRGAILSQIVILNRGQIGLVTDHRDGRQEVSMGYEGEDIPAQFTAPWVPMKSQPHATIDIAGRYGTWKGIADGLAGSLKDYKIPGNLVKSVKDTLKDASPLEAVRALARYLDDPAQLRLEGGPRGGLHGGDLEDAVRSRSATAFEKGLLAYGLLRALKIDSTVLLGASRFLTDLDWRSRDMSQLDAVLIWIPSISENFLWDVADRRVPLGQAGSDLYSEMLVLDPDELESSRDFHVEEGRVRETRSFELHLEEGGEMEGNLTYRFESFPLDTQLDPWDREADLDKVLGELVPHEVELSGIAWQEPRPAGMRCTPETPAVLEARLTEEAIPAGETGWDIVPFLLPLPEKLGILGDPDREAPLVISDSYEIIDAVLVDVGGHHVVHLPQPTTVRTRVGTFGTSWEEKPNGVVAVRRLSVDGSVNGIRDQSAVAALCKAWRESQSQALRVN